MYDCFVYFYSLTFSERNPVSERPCFYGIFVLSGAILCRRDQNYDLQFVWVFSLVGPSSAETTEQKFLCWLVKEWVEGKGAIKRGLSEKALAQWRRTVP